MLPPTLSLVLVASVLSVMTLPAHPASAATAKPACPSSRPDDVSASITARLCGDKVLIGDDESSVALVYALPDGSFQAMTSQAPQRVQQQDHSWAPVDLTLTPNADGSVSPKMSAFAVTFAGATTGVGSHSLAALGAGNSQTSIEWTGALPAPSLSGNTATYPDVRPGIDLVVSVTAAGIEQNLVLKNSAAIAQLAGLDLPVTSPADTSYTLSDNGVVTLTDAQGHAVAQLPQMLMWDSAADPVTGGPDKVALAADFSREAAGDGHDAGVDITLTPDTAWLNDPGRQFPITLDPTINQVSTTEDTYVKQGSTANYGGDNTLTIGVTSTGYNTRTFMTWDMTGLRHAVISSATVYLYNYYSGSCTQSAATQWDMWYDTSPASGSTTYATQPAGVTLESNSIATLGYGAACPDGWVSIDAKNFFTTAASTGYASAYMQLRADDESPTSIGFKQFRSRQAADPSQVPYAVVTYTSTPVIGTRSTVPATTCATGASAPYLASKTPTLTSAVNQGDGATSTVNFQWWNASGTTMIGSASVSGVVSGNTASTSVPTGQFAEATGYEWRVDATSGVATSAWSPWCAFTVDTIAPTAAPTVSSTTYPANTWGGAAGTSGTFTLGANGVSDVSSYRYSLDQGSMVPVAAASLGGNGTTSITPATAGPHTLTVQSLDRAGNISPATTYSFDAGTGALLLPLTGITSAGLSQLQGLGESATTGVTYQWKRATTDSWANIPTGDVSVAAGGSVSTWPEATSGSGNYPLLNWNVRQTLANANTPSGIAGRWLLNDGTGTTCADASSLGHPATASGSLTWTGAHGGAAIFNGTTSQCATSSTVINTAANFSIGAWVYLTSTAANEIIVSENSTQQSGFDLRYQKSSNKWAFGRWNADIATPPTFISASGSFTALNTWTHLVGTFNSSTGLMTLYINGVSAGTATDSTPFTATGALVIGRGEFNGAANSYYAGDISDVQTYTAVLTAAQVSALYAGTQTTGSAAALSGPVQVQAVFTGTGGGTSPASTITFDPNLAGGTTSTVGPGTVNLVTGNFAVSASDVLVSTYDSDLMASRTFNSRQPGVFDTTHMFGPGWISSATVDSANSPYTSLSVNGTLIQIGASDGSTIGFTASSATAFTPQVGSENLALTYTSGASPYYTLIDQKGNKVIFSQITGAPAAQFTPTAVMQPGSNQTTTMAWTTSTVDGVTATQPTTILATLPTGVTSCSPMVKGCRELTYTYGSATTATGTTQAGWGDYLGRVKTISFTAWDPATSTIKTVAVAAYTYDSNGRLVAAWDPRLDNGATHLWTTYTYNGDGTLATITANTQPAWTLAYTTVPNDLGIGRLASISRSALTAGTATTTVVYNVPLTTALGGPYNMDSGSSGTTAQWNEIAGPVQATAIFDAEQIPGGTQSTGVMPTSWTDATVTYMDANSNTLNTVTPGGNVTTNWYDQYGNAVQTLTADNRAEALAAAAGNLAKAQTLAGNYSTFTTYTDNGMFEASTEGPYHLVTLANGTTTMARSTSAFTPPTAGTCTCQLPVSDTDAITYWTGGAPGVGTEVDNAEPHTTTVTYDWSLLEPLVTTIDPSGLALTTTNSYDSTTGLLTSVTSPAGGATINTPATTTTTYYTTAANATYPECGLHPEWANLTCRTGFGGQPATGPELPATETTYDMFNKPLVVTEKISSGTLRTTTNGYDADERPLTTSIVGATGTGAALPTTQRVYDPATGYLTHVESITTGTPETTTAYDTLGRITSYTDTDGNASTTSYDLMSRPTTTSDGLQSSTASYEISTEHRGLPTKIIDGQAGTITGSYDADGNLTTENWPNGIVVTHSYDETGTETGISYTKPGCGQPDCTLYTESNAMNSAGLVASSNSSLESETYTYDADHRLSTVQDYDSNNCTTRVYGFGTSAAGKASDRTSLTAYAPNSDGTCQQTTGTATAWTYDTADRLSSTGYTYDSLGRTTTIPSVDTQLSDGGDVAITYDVNDFVNTIQQGTSATSTYVSDVDSQVGNQRTRSWTDSAGVTHTNHYSKAGSDSPVWTNEGSGVSDRNIGALSGLVATASGSNIGWDLSDIHGNIVATVNNSDPGVDSVSLSDEFGNMANITQVGSDRYGWLGQAQRAASNPGGIVLMGVRLYNPTTGRFLSVDPITGGNANPYDYVSGDPINNFDLNGMCGVFSSWKCFIKNVVRYAIEGLFASLTALAVSLCAGATGGLCGFVGSYVGGAMLAAANAIFICWYNGSCHSASQYASAGLGAFFFAMVTSYWVTFWIPAPLLAKVRVAIGAKFLGWVLAASRYF